MKKNYYLFYIDDILKLNTSRIENLRKLSNKFEDVRKVKEILEIQKYN